MTRSVYAINLDFRCNERCVFCAADLGGDVPAQVRRPSLTWDVIDDWLAGDVPGPGDKVILSGGEPTLHRHLVQITSRLAAGGAEVVLFTNGMRLADPELAAATAQAGVRRYEISIYGPDSSTHDAITQRPGSFDRTLVGLRNLTGLRKRFGVTLSIRLLVSRATVESNPETMQSLVDLLRADGGADCFSLNHLVRSQDALNSNAPISWSEARDSVNACARIARTLGAPLTYTGVPMCVLDAENLAAVLHSESQNAAGLEAGPIRYRYLDPLNGRVDPTPHSEIASPPVCLVCGVADVCERVDQGYLAQFGPDGLRALPSLETTR